MQDVNYAGSGEKKFIGSLSHVVVDEADVLLDVSESEMRQLFSMLAYGTQNLFDGNARTGMYHSKDFTKFIAMMKRKMDTRGQKTSFAFVGATLPTNFAKVCS